MNCPYCARHIYGLSRLIEAEKFQRHLLTCRKRPGNVVIRDGRRVAVGTRGCSFIEALRIREESGQ